MHVEYLVRLFKVIVTCYIDRTIYKQQTVDKGFTNDDDECIQ